MVTIADVAKHAGVSVSTAARVLSGRGYASDETRRIVLEAARALGYVPNQIARSLRTRRTRTIGLLIGDVENSFYSTIAKNVESVATRAGYHVVLCNSDDEPEVEREYLRLLDGVRVDGRVEGLEADAILVDNEAGGYSGVEHLIEAGHDRIGILAGDVNVLTASQRLAGYERALKEHALPVRRELIKVGSFHREHAIEDATELIGVEPRPTAIFAANNILAEACLIALADLGLRVPRDMSVVGFDDVPWMGMVNPPLTTVRQPVADVARSAAELMLRRLEGDGQAQPSTQVFRTELLVRGSVAAVRKTRP